MTKQNKSRFSQYEQNINVHKRPLHRLVLIISLLFLFLLVLESCAFIVLGAWHLITPRLQNVLDFSTDIYHRELVFGILLVITGAIGILLSIIGSIGFITLRLFLLRMFTISLWFLIIFGIVVGVIGIIFASQVNAFIPEQNNSDINIQIYTKEKFMLAMNGGIALFMTLVLSVGVIIVGCFTDDVSSYLSGHSYLQP